MHTQEIVLKIGPKKTSGIVGNPHFPKLWQLIFHLFFWHWGYFRWFSFFHWSSAKFILKLPRCRRMWYLTLGCIVMKDHTCGICTCTKPCVSLFTLWVVVSHSICLRYLLLIFFNIVLSILGIKPLLYWNAIDCVFFRFRFDE